MTDGKGDGFAPFEEDHRRFGAGDRAFSRRLRIIAVAGLSSLSILLIAAVYFTVM